MSEMSKAIILILALIAGCCVLGCKGPVANYTIETKIPNVYASKVCISGSNKPQYPINKNRCHNVVV